MKFKISIKPWVNIFKMIKYNHKAWLKPHTDMNTIELKKHRLYQKEKIKKVIGLMKDELSRKMMQEFLGLIRAKTYSYLIDDQQQ